MPACFQLQISGSFQDPGFTVDIRDQLAQLLIQENDDDLSEALATATHRFADLLHQQPHLRLALRTYGN